MKKTSDYYAEALIAQLDDIEAAFTVFMEQKNNQDGDAPENAGPEAYTALLEALNNSIFNFYILYYGRPEFADDTEDETMTAIAMSASEMAAETAVFDEFIKHLDALNDDEIYIKTLVSVAKEDRDRTFNAFLELCGEYEKSNPIEEMRENIRKNRTEPLKKYAKYSKKQSKKLLKTFDKRAKKLAKKRSAKRYNSFYEALASLYLHMELLNFFSDQPGRKGNKYPDFAIIKQELKKLLEAMEDYSSRLNLKVLAKEYQAELELDKEEFKMLMFPKAGKKELKKILEDAKRLRKGII